MTGRVPQLAVRIDALLPQTQCRQCGYAGCLPYAEAIAAGVADINQCPPGGELLVAELAALLGTEFKPLNPRFGIAGPRAVALIDEARCIGCKLCLQACPVDAIVGAARMMHTVITRECTGCGLCLPPCPVNCIAMVTTGGESTPAERRLMADRARLRYQRRIKRLARKSELARDPRRDKKQLTVQRAIARARRRLAERNPPSGGS
jgi:Na+-translocating ferredoxin:NAD+ oxidoreductase subunit B